MIKYINVGKIVNTHALKGEVRIISDFEFKGFDELNKETNANIHWALFVCEHLNKTADKRKYWSEFKKYTLSKNSSLKEELKNSKPDFNKQPDFYL